MTGDEQGGVAGGARLSASQRHHGHEGDARRRIPGRHPQAGDEPQAPRGRPGEAPALRPRLAAQALHRLAQHSHVRVRGILFYRARVSLGVSVKQATSIHIHFLHRVKQCSGALNIFLRSRIRGLVYLNYRTGSGRSINYRSLRFPPGHFWMHLKFFCKYVGKLFSFFLLIST